jgi:hypothetical protein
MGRAGYQTLVGHLLPVAPGPPSTASTPAPEAPRVESPGDHGEVAEEMAQLKTGVRDQAVPVIDLDPESLRVYAHELEFARVLWPLIATPRAAKRLINTYRLLRASLPEVEFRSLVREEPTGDYPLVLLLLAALIGFSREARAFFDLLMLLPETDDFWSVVENAHESVVWRGLAKALPQVRLLIPGELPLARIHPWVPRVARYSFQTSRIATG